MSGQDSPSPEPAGAELALSRDDGKQTPRGACTMLAVRSVPKYEGYDPVRDEKEYARSLLSPEDLAKVKQDTDANGFMQVKEIQALIACNTSARYTSEGIFSLDADLIAEIDMRTNEPVFILSDNTVFSRVKLMATYPFEMFHTSPEVIFAQQELGVFPVRASGLDQTAKEYLTRDLGTDDEFVMFEDFIGREARANYKDRRPIERTVKTKIFLARDGWDDFMTLSKHVRAMRRIVGPALGQPGGANLALMFGLGEGGATSPAAIESADQVDERHRAQAAELTRREAELAQREADLAAALDRQAQKIAKLLESM